METTATNAKTSQGDKKAEERNPSLSYTIKSLGGNIKKLIKLKALDKKRMDELVTIHKELVNAYIGGSLGV